MGSLGWWVGVPSWGVGLEDGMGDVRDVLVWVVCLAALGMMRGGEDLLGEWLFLRVLDWETGRKVV